MQTFFKYVASKSMLTIAFFYINITSDHILQFFFCHIRTVTWDPRTIYKDVVVGHEYCENDRSVLPA